MTSFLDGILPKISRLSKRFDKKDSYTGKSWVLIDDSNRALVEFEFFVDGRLLIIMNGNAMWGKWEVSPNTSRLILDFDEKVTVYEVSFVDQTLMFARKSSTKNLEVFVNKKELPSLVFQYYLDSLVHTIEAHNTTPLGKQSEPRKGYREHLDKPVLRHGPSPLLLIWHSLTNYFYPEDKTVKTETWNNDASGKNDTMLIIIVLLACAVGGWIIANW